MFCTKCGKQLNDDALFCGACGTPVSKSQNVVAPPVVEVAPVKQEVTVPDVEVVSPGGGASRGGDRRKGDGCVCRTARSRGGDSRC